MFTIERNNKKTEFRNLEEQVLKNKEDIARHYEIDRALANFGIKVIGRVTTANDLPDPVTYQGVYGDAYAVGNSAQINAGIGSYKYFIFTRPDPNSGEFTNYWLDVGSISVVGPQGPQGPKGEKGDTGESTQWYAANTAPDIGDVNPGDFYLNTASGNVYKCVLAPDGVSKNWISQLNIVGPQGPQGIRGIDGAPGAPGEQGPKGEQGPAGGFINIMGKLTSSAQLPNPAELDDLTKAFIVEEDGQNNLYIQIGANSDVATWNNVGPLNLGTIVKSGGIFVPEWNADTKADEWTGVGSYLTFRGRLTNAQGTQTIYSAAYTQPTASAIAMYDGNQRLKSVNPSSGLDVTNKQFCDANYVSKRTTATTYDQAYIKKADGTQDVISVYNQAEPGTIPRRDATGNFYVSSPELSNHCATKGYVDRNTRLYFHKVTIRTRTASDPEYGAYIDDTFEINFLTKSATQFTLQDCFEETNGTNLKFKPYTSGYFYRLSEGPGGIEVLGDIHPIFSLLLQQDTRYIVVGPTGPALEYGELNTSTASVYDIVTELNF